ncbi:MAG: helix-turn-helix domain-containing protein [Alphaproteobacteria bacterium]|nr:helix-turn-helix domain-containing protein [Alphaproteobacteria bacterium]
MEIVKQDKIRVALRRLIDDRGVDMATVSRAIGKNHAYIQQFLNRGVPTELGYKTAIALAEYFGCGADVFGIAGGTYIRPSNDTGRNAGAPMRHPLQSIRRLMGLTTAQMAKALGEKESALAAIENGQASLTEKLLLKISRTFHIEPEDLAAYAPALTPDERVMLLRFRQLSPDQRKTLDNMLAGFEKERA